MTPSTMGNFWEEGRNKSTIEFSVPLWYSSYLSVAYLTKKTERTLGVITKIDLMDSGTDALEALEGKIIPLR